MPKPETHSISLWTLPSLDGGVYGTREMMLFSMEITLSLGDVLLNLEFFSL
jgi:hypothetical protein